MHALPEPALWQTSGFWATVYLLVILAVAAWTTMGKAEAARRRVLRPLVIAAALLCLAIHAWAGYEFWRGAPGVLATGGVAGLRPTVEQVRDLLAGSVAACTLFATTVALAAAFVRPAGDGIALPWSGLTLAGLLVLAAALLPDQGTSVQSTVWVPVRPVPPWIERAPAFAAMGTVVAGGFVLIRAVQCGERRTRVDGLAVESRVRRSLALWGLLLTLGAVVTVEGQALSLLESLPDPGIYKLSWSAVARLLLQEARIPALLAFIGLLALAFGGLHLRRRDGASEGAS